jgi:hypothetical protein
MKPPGQVIFADFMFNVSRVWTYQPTMVQTGQTVQNNMRSFLFLY